MDDYFEKLANSLKETNVPQDATNKQKTDNQNQTAFVTIKVDINSLLYCDGDFLDLVEANKVKKVVIPIGQHLMTVVSEENKEISEDQLIDASELGKNYILLINGMQNKMLEAENARKASLLQEAIKNKQKGIDLFNSKDIDSAIVLLKKAADFNSDPEALFYVGKCYQEGSHKDYAMAFQWYVKSADQGYAKAQNNLGYCYHTGQGVTKDCTEAVKWFRKAAEQGEIVAQYNLGLCYFTGQGVPKDCAEAVKWYRKSAEKGYPAAQCDLGYCYHHGEGVPQDFAEAVKWNRKAAEQGNAGAQNNLGYCYFHGEGVPQDFAEAVKWYRKSAEKGDAYGQCSLGSCYHDGKGVPQDFAEAVKWYRKSAEQGNVNAQNLLGDYYEKRFIWNFPINANDGVEAVKWYTAAIKQGSSYAKQKLEKLHLCPNCGSPAWPWVDLSRKDGKYHTCCKCGFGI